MFILALLHRHPLFIPLGFKKPPITVAPLPSNLQDAMAFWFVDPQPFIPNGAQRIMVPDRPPMKRVVTGRVHKQNNDLVIATFSPLP